MHSSFNVLTYNLAQSLPFVYKMDPYMVTFHHLFTFWGREAPPNMQSDGMQSEQVMKSDHVREEGPKGESY